MKKILLCAILLAATYVSHAQNVNSGYTPPAEREEALANGIRCYRNIRYGDIPEMIPDSTSDRLLDIYLPADPQGKKLPVLFFVHGGGFVGGSKDANSYLLKDFVNAGFAVVSINYRLTLKYDNPERVGATKYFREGPGVRQFPDRLNITIDRAVEDAATALQWICDNAGKYDLDTDRIAVSGGSAGAITVLYLTYNSAYKTLPIKAVVNFWGCLEHASAIRARKNLPPVLTYHGDNDALVHVDYARELHKRMNKLGSKQSKLIIMEGLGHAQYRYISKNRIGEIAEFLNEVMK